MWLSGVRRVGKTTLARSLPNAEFLNCDLPSTQMRLVDPESFYRGLSNPCLILDEVHQLPDPSGVLKIAADAFPDLRVLATGSSTLAATSKFKDSLTGRKRNLHLVPVRFDELLQFGVRDLGHRLFRGGLPPTLLAESYDPGFSTPTTLGMFKNCSGWKKGAVFSSWLKVSSALVGDNWRRLRWLTCADGVVRLS